MSLYNRIAGTEDPKIPVWPIMLDITRVLDSEITLDQLAERHELTVDEKAEAGVYIQAIGDAVSSRVSSLYASGIDSGLSVILARASLDSQLRYALLRAENGIGTEQQLRDLLGIE